MTRRGSHGALALILLALAGCGSLGSGEVTERVEGPDLLTEHQVERYPEGSPARAVFGWWRALQFDNPVAASRYYARSLRMDSADLERQLLLGASALGLRNRPHLVDVRQAGNRATVQVLLEESMTNPNGRVDTTRVARGFNLVRERGEWTLAENLYLERKVRLALAGAAQGQGAAGE